MENQHPTQESFFERIKEYVHLRIRLAVLQSTEKVASLYASILSNLVLGIWLLMCILFASVALAYYLAEQLQSTWCGFLCVAGIYFVLALVWLLIRKKAVEKPLMDQAVRAILGQQKGDQDE